MVIDLICNQQARTECPHSYWQDFTSNIHKSYHYILSHDIIYNVSYIIYIYYEYKQRAIWDQIQNFILFYWSRCNRWESFSLNHQIKLHHSAIKCNFAYANTVSMSFIKIQSLSFQRICQFVVLSWLDQFSSCGNNTHINATSLLLGDK